MPEPIDIHCLHCNQVIVPHDRMKSLLNWNNQQRHAAQLMVTHIAGTVVLVEAKMICTNCGRMVYFSLSEQKLNILLESVRHG